MAGTRGPQPAKQLLRDKRINVTTAARTMDVHYGHLQSVLAGAAAPSPQLRERLPELLGVPLEECFTPELLAKTWTGPRDPRPVREITR